LNRWWHQVRGKENPYLKIGDANDRSTKGESGYVWAFQDINFEVERGEVYGKLIEFYWKENSELAILKVNQIIRIKS
jgi:hypothetical protein